MSTHYINVTKRDIKLGKPCQGGYCPISLAARRIKAFDDKFPVVTNKWIVLNMGIVHLPTEAKQFVSNFDKKKRVKPFRFKVELH